MIYTSSCFLCSLHSCLSHFSLLCLQQSIMLFPSNHQDLATVQRHFHPNLHSLLHPPSLQCLQLPHLSFSPRFLSPSPHSLSPALASRHRHPTASWAPSRRSLPKPCWRTMRSQRPPALRPHRSARSTASCSHFSPEPPRKRCTRILPCSWGRHCMRRS